MIRNRIYYGIIIGFALLLIWLFGTRLAYTFLYAVLLFPVCSLIVTVILSRCLSLTQTLLSETAYKDDVVSCRVTIKNRSPLPCGFVKLFYTDDNKLLGEELPTSELTLLPLGTWQGEASFHCRYRGIYSVGIDKIRLLDYLGLFHITARCRKRVTLTVFPRILDLTSLPTTLYSIDVHATQSRVEDDYTTILDTRQYVPTDSMKRIHWKLSSKKNELIVKNFGSTADFSTVVLLNLKPPACHSILNHLEKIELEDRMIEGAVAIINYCVRCDQSANFVYATNETYIHPVTISGGVQHLYEVCASLVFNGEVPLSQLLEDYSTTKQEAANYWVLTAEVDDALFEALYMIYNSGRGVTLFLFTAPQMNAQQHTHVADLRELGVKVHQIAPQNDIRSIHENDSAETVYTK